MPRVSVLVCFALAVSATSANASCLRYTAPYAFPNEPQAWGNDSGPIVTEGFVDTRSPRGGIFNAVHGIDVAAGDNVNYSKFVECGGGFAIVRINHSITKKGQISGPIDQEFALHMREFAAHGISGIPYFYFSLPSSLKRLNDLDRNFSNNEFDALRDKYFQFGQQSAQIFLSYVEELSGQTKDAAVPENDIAGIRAKFVALDVEEVPVGSTSAADISGKNYGRLYAAAVCAWVQSVRQRYPNFVPILYTFPAIYGEYLQYALPRDNACLQGLPVWIARTYGNGWEAIRDTNPSNCAKRNSSICATDRYVKLTCEIQAGNRCIIHQYTHRGTPFALGSTGKNGFPPHFDLDRFYIAKVSTTNTTPQYVRVEDSFKQ
jgi:hypothetical protein